MTTEHKIIELLNSTQRKGIDALIEYLKSNNFFVLPASHRFHGVKDGGLAEHSLQVYELLAQYNLSLNLKVADESIIISALLHDVCKIGLYKKEFREWTKNRDNDKGHSILSIKRIKQFIELTELEEKMILYHMGIYGLKEFDEKQGEYTLRNESMANAWYHFPIVKVMYFCDELATMMEKAEVKK